jgi:hypothetical protein
MSACKREMMLQIVGYHSLASSIHHTYISCSGIVSLGRWHTPLSCWDVCTSASGFAQQSYICKTASPCPTHHALLTPAHDAQRAQDGFGIHTLRFTVAVCTYNCTYNCSALRWAPEHHSAVHHCGRLIIATRLSSSVPHGA